MDNSPRTGQYSNRSIYDVESCLYYQTQQNDVPKPIGIGATLGGGAQNFCRKIYILKISKIPEFYMILARKIYKIPEFYMIFARKMSEFYIIIAGKIFFPNFREARAPLPPMPMLKPSPALLFTIQQLYYK